MSRTVTLGGDRVGSGNKQKIALKGYERSTHDLSYLWRSTMSAGTLVPFMSELGLAGDSFDIILDCDMKTNPTIGPLFGSYKVQLDVYEVPVRLYNAALHMNKLNIGLNMKTVRFPLVKLRGTKPTPETIQGGLNNFHVNPSCIFSYFNIRGLGSHGSGTLLNNTITRDFNAVPWLAYWDIYKNYYANKQEEEGVVIHNPLKPSSAIPLNIVFSGVYENGNTLTLDGTPTENLFVQLNSNRPITAEINFTNYDAFDPTRFRVYFQRIYQGWLSYDLTEMFGNIYFDTANQKVILQDWLNPSNAVFNSGNELSHFVFDTEVRTFGELRPQLVRFPLENIDHMRERILQADQDSILPVMIDADYPEEPYKLALTEVLDVNNYFSIQSNQEGLAIKTYQSDLFNNWMNTEWLDGTNGINEVTAVQIQDDKFYIDDLNLSKKIYDMLNRIAVSGGTYEDWLEVTYDINPLRRAESPMYRGGLIKELAFQEVISNAQAEQQPLGTLAGRGTLTSKHKGGKINIKLTETSYIIGIISLTPRIDYSQGNKWDTTLVTMDDLHKPALDQIGFQELITDQMCWFDTQITQVNDDLSFPVYKSAGKQPAWVNYTTNVNVIRGNFANEYDQQFMVIDRRYEEQWDITNQVYTIKDLTTYIDPSKFNHIFAYTRLDAQNFQAQIKCNITARRKMSARMIPNL